MNGTRTRPGSPVFQGTSPVTASYQGQIEYAVCPQCSQVNEAHAKFCGSCGLASQPVPQFQPRPTVDAGAITIPNFGGTGPLTVPNFATVTTAPPKKSNALHDEMNTLTLTLMREQMLLALHWFTFFAGNLVGLWLAMKCYNEFLGDEVTRVVIATTPLLFINSCAFLCIVTINGTNKEIARLKERISYIKFKLEYGHLI